MKDDEDVIFQKVCRNILKVLDDDMMAANVRALYSVLGGIILMRAEQLPRDQQGLFLDSNMEIMSEVIAEARRCIDDK